MPSQHTTVKSSDGGDIPTYIATPDSGTGPGVVIIPSIMGVASDIIAWAGSTRIRMWPIWKPFSTI